MSSSVEEIKLDAIMSHSDDEFLGLYHTPPPSEGEPVPIGSPFSHGEPGSPMDYNCESCLKVEKWLSEMQAHIITRTGNFTTQQPVEDFPNKAYYFGKLKDLVRRSRRVEDTPCVCKYMARFHADTGRCNLTVLALSYAYHASRMKELGTGHDEIITTLETNYQNWKRHITRKRESKTKDWLLVRMGRYEEVVEHNRLMYSTI